MSETIRLTVGQAVVKFLGQQYSERDGIRQRLVTGMFGIFGHGNVCGVGQALLQDQVDFEASGAQDPSRPATSPITWCATSSRVSTPRPPMPAPSTGDRSWP